MNQSENIDELAKALCKAQASMTAAPKLKSNPFFKSKYADLPAVWEACRKPLTDNGLSIVQATQFNVASEDDPTLTVWLETILLHTSGQFLKANYPLRPVKQNDPQAMISALTYARRSCLSAITSVVADEFDDDGNAASATTAAPNFTASKTNKKISVKERDKLKLALDADGVNIEQFCEYLKVDALAELTDIKSAYIVLEKRRDQRAGAT